jgi:ketol-acid reductoisomerase
MAKFYFEKDADFELIRDKAIAVVGYGNQGRSQALNLRDNGFKVIIGNIDDVYSDQAKKDGFKVYSIAKATQKGDILLMLLPDEIAPEVYSREIHKNLKKKDVLCFASGYNITYDYISPPSFIDLILVAPRMGGPAVRETYLRKDGFVSLIGTSQDFSGQALNIAVAVCMGIGSAKGALLSSFEEETIIDLFGEQIEGMSLYTTQLAFETLLAAGCSPEASLLELYLSEEPSEDWRNFARIGLWKQLRGHSRTSQYGQMTRGELAASEETRKLFAKIIEDIKCGKFAREWMLEQKSGLTVFKRMMKRNLNHPINKSEESLLKVLEKRSEERLQKQASRFVKRAKPRAQRPE